MDFKLIKEALKSTYLSDNPDAIEELLQAAYSYYLDPKRYHGDRSDLFWQMSQLMEISHIMPDENTVQAAYDFYFSKDEQKPDVRTITEIKNITGYTPVFNEKVLQKAFDELLSKNTSWDIESIGILRELTGRKPKYSQQQIDKAYLNILNSTSWSDFFTLYESSRMKSSDEVMYECYQKYLLSIAGLASVCMSDAKNYISKLNGISGFKSVPIKAIDEVYSTINDLVDADTSKKVEAMKLVYDYTRIKPLFFTFTQGKKLGRGNSKVLEMYEELTDIALVNALYEMTDVKPPTNVLSRAFMSSLPQEVTKEYVKSVVPVY